MNEVSIWLDTYDDLYSDFDPRPFSKRLVSHDFIDELKRNLAETPFGPVHVTLFIPDARRQSSTETEIISSLQNFFTTSLQAVKAALRNLFIQGIIMGLTGIGLLLTATYMAYEESPGFLATAITVVLQPAGWFLVWNGLDHIFFESKTRRSERKFLDKMCRSQLRFGSLRQPSS